MFCLRRNNWRPFRPITNLYWLHYLMEKLLHETSYPRRDPDSQAVQSELAALHDSVLSGAYDSATGLVSSSFYFDTCRIEWWVKLHLLLCLSFLAPSSPLSALPPSVAFNESSPLFLFLLFLCVFVHTCVKSTYSVQSRAIAASQIQFNCINANKKVLLFVSPVCTLFCLVWYKYIGYLTGITQIEHQNLSLRL